jgi:hypothetical protein
VPVALAPDLSARHRRRSARWRGTECLVVCGEPMARLPSIGLLAESGAAAGRSTPPGGRSARGSVPGRGASLPDRLTWDG